MTIYIPSVPKNMERFGNCFTRFVGRLILRIMGWRFEGRLPNEKKLLFIVAPHTSNWDFFLGITAVFAIGFRVNWLGKHTIFRKPFGTYMKWMGGIPVDRGKAGHVVDQVIARIRESDGMALGMSPEGTRKKVSHWKSGFYRIAEGAGIPIVPVSLDYAKKTITFMPPFVPTGNQKSDVGILQHLFDGVTAKYPEKF
ncbi:MAG: acyltransferase [Acidobacteria bacterium]|nr:acyltransferase [Acidobacteriota bacterium]